MKKLWLTSMNTVLISSFMLLSFSSCQSTGSVEPVAPASFAIEKEPSSVADDVIFAAVSYSGVTYRVRTKPNEPKADLKFWQEGLEKHLKDSGYLFLKRKKIMASKQPGYLMNFLAPTKNADYRFSVALFVINDEIVIVESAGDEKAFKKVRKKILKAVKSIKFKA